MKKRFAIIIIYVCVIVSGCSAQEATKNENKFINMLNSDNKKEGLWIDTTSSIITEVYYKDGIKHGIFKSYYTTSGKLYGLGKYENGLLVGSWLIFSETGHLWREETQFQYLDDNSLKSYIREYNLIGNLEKEGWVIYYDSEETLEYKEIGDWKYYPNE